MAIKTWTEDDLVVGLMVKNIGCDTMRLARGSEKEWVLITLGGARGREWTSEGLVAWLNAGPARIADTRVRGII